MPTPSSMFIDENAPWRRILRNQMLSLGIIAVFTVLAILSQSSGFMKLPATMLPINVLGIALTVIVAFRNNAAYDRYWEARKLWGSLVNSARTLGRQVVTFLVVPTDAHPDTRAAMLRWRGEMVNGTVAYIHALRCSLHDEGPWDDLRGLLPDHVIQAMRDQRSPPTAVATWLSRRATEATALGWISELKLQRIDASIQELVNHQGGCERIKRTPIPMYFSFFTYYIVRVYCIMLPFGLVRELGLYTIPASLAFAIVFHLLDAFGRLIEAPFGSGPVTLPLTSLALTIEINLKQMLVPLNEPVADAPALSAPTVPAANANGAVPADRPAPRPARFDQEH